MSDSLFAAVFGASIPVIPVAIVCIAGLVGVVRSKIIPSTAARMAAVGFVFIIVHECLSVTYQALLPTMNDLSESTSSFLNFVAVFSFVQLILFTLGIALIARAVFSGRKEN